VSDFLDHEARASVEIDTSGGGVDPATADHMRCDRPGCRAFHVLVPQLPKQRPDESALAFETRERPVLRRAVIQAEGCGWERTIEAGSLVDLCPAHKEPT
jgi:hypothetical protein